MSIGAGPKKILKRPRQEVVHQIREVKGNDVKTKCHQSTTKEHATVWWRDVTCEVCRGA